MRVVSLLDVSVPIAPDLPVWPSDPGIRVEPAKRISRGDGANVSLLTLGNHSGTHVDPPLHFIEGAAGVDELDLDALVGPAFVAHLPEARGELSAADLDAVVPPDVERLLLRTRNSGTLAPGRPFGRDFVSLSAEAAGWAVGRRLRLVGIDYLSIERADPPRHHPVHTSLLREGIVIVEGLDLSEAPPGPCEVMCLPLRIRGADGAPARVLLRVPG